MADVTMASDDDGTVGTASAASVAAAGAAPAEEDDTFDVCGIRVKNSIFDDVLNARKLELLSDPDIAALLRASRKGGGGHAGGSGGGGGGSGARERTRRK